MDKQELIREYERVKDQRAAVASDYYDMRAAGTFTRYYLQCERQTEILDKKFFDLRHQLGIADDDLTR